MPLNPLSYGTDRQKISWGTATNVRGDYRSIAMTHNGEVREPIILVVRQGELKRRSLSDLRKAGVIVVESQNPSEVRLLRPACEVDGDTLLKAALKALCKVGEYGNKGILQRETFTVLLSKYMNASESTPPEESHAA